jgi:hypothetical protein
MGIVYIIHLFDKMHHAQHYVGWVKNWDNLYPRMRLHYDGLSRVPFMEAVSQKQIKWGISKIYMDQDRHFERTLKNRKKTPQYCPYGS